MTAREDSYCRSLGWVFFADGYAPEDIAQEARLAMLTAEPAFRRRAARNRVLNIVRAANAAKRGRSVELRDWYVGPDLVERTELREQLRAIVTAPRTANEREAVGRCLRGEPNLEPRLSVALHRVRQRLAA